MRRNELHDRQRAAQLLDSGQISFYVGGASDKMIDLATMRRLQASRLRMDEIDQWYRKVIFTVFQGPGIPARPEPGPPGTPVRPG